MDGPVQILGFLSVSDLAAGNIYTRVHTRHGGAEAIEIHSEIVAGVKGGKASSQSREWCTRLGSGSISGQQPMGLQAGGELFLCFASASGRVGGILGIFPQPLDGIQGL